jgi:hypothetical protein
MRTKILLIAAATFALGVVASNAQVYSANIVGYTTYVTQTNSPGYELYSLQLDSGSNTIKNIFQTAPATAQVIVWQNGGFNIATYSSALGGHWKTNGVTADNMIIAPGAGFFIKTPSPFTNIFLGSVTPSTGVTVNNTIASGYQLVGSQIPYADAITNPATINIVGVPATTQLIKWSPTTQGFNIYTWSTALGGHWKLNGVNNTPSLAVNEGFFFNSPSNYVWTQTGP